MSGGGNSRNDGYSPTPAPVNSSKPSGNIGGGSGGGMDPCDVVEVVPLNSPQPPVVAGLNIGDILLVALNRAGPNPVLEVLAPSGQRAGALTHRNHIRIINCIDAGRIYRAVVMTIRGGSVEVRIEPA
jgi:hypothetical protein